MRSPFSDYADTLSETIIAPVTEQEVRSPFVGSSFEDIYTDEKEDGESITPQTEGELSGSELQKAVELNEQYKQEHRWGPFVPPILGLMDVPGDMLTSAVTDPRKFAQAVAGWQEKNRYKTSLKGVFGLNDWSYFQKKLAFHNLSNKYSINVEKATHDNNYYGYKLWGNEKDDIYQRFAANRIVYVPLPLSDEYFAYAVADFQALKRLKVDGILGPITWTALKTTPAPSAPQQAPGSITRSRWHSVIPDAVMSPATPLVDGANAFPEMIKAIQAAGANDFIYILGWMLDVDFAMQPGISLFSLLADADKRGAQIRILIWHNNSYINQLKKIKQRIDNLPNRNAQMFLDDKTFGATSVALALAGLRGGIASVPYAAQYLLSKVDTWNELVAYSNQPNEGSHHEKIVVVSNQGKIVGFCGGIDINPNRLIDHYDTHCRFEGHAAWRLLQEFIRRWNIYTGLSQIKIPALLGEAGKFKDPPAEVPGAPFVKICHTYNNKQRNIRDRSIHDTLGKVIANAKRSVYLEDQYMVSCEIAGWLNKKLVSDSNFKVRILTEHDTVAKEDIKIPHRKRAEFIRKLTAGIKNPANVKVQFLDQMKSGPLKVVHSKIYIIDEEEDGIAFIGSSNCNRRSMTNDTEAGAFIFNDNPQTKAFVSDLKRAIDQRHPESRNTAYSAMLYYSGDMGEEILAKATSLAHSLLPTSVSGVVKGILTGGVSTAAGLSASAMLAIIQPIVNKLMDYLWEVIDPNPDNIVCSIPSASNQENFEPEYIGLTENELLINTPFTDSLVNGHGDLSNERNREDLLPAENNFLYETPKATVASCEGRTCWAKNILNKLTGSSLPLNNNVDAQTANAIGVFQSQNNLPQTKRIDAATERALLEADAVLRDQGTPNEPSTINCISNAKTKIEDWTSKAVNTKSQYILNSYRDPRKIYAFVLHQMAFKRKGAGKKYSDPASYLSTGAHFCILLDGRIIQLHPISRMIWHGNCVSPRSVGVEFEGNFPNIKGKWWVDATSKFQNKDVPTQAQFDAGRFLAGYLKVVLGITHILAHRQSSDARENDPGPDVWYNVGQWSVTNLGLSDGGPAFKCGTGNPILPEWRTWGERSTAAVKEFSDYAMEAEWEDEEESFSVEPELIDETEWNYEDENAVEAFYPETEELLTDLPNVVAKNRFYAAKLGWNQYHEKINDLLLPFSGQQNVSLGEEAFAYAVSNWQKLQGFSEKDCDGIIGPRAWAAMQKFLFNETATTSTPVVLPAPASGSSIETAPATYSSEKVPPGFVQGSYRGWHGLDRKTTVRVDEAAKRLNADGALAKNGITEIDIDTFQRLANAETGGKIQNFYSLDMAIVSMGFRQFTFIHGNLHNWISKAPAAFKRYGIEIDDAAPNYSIKRSTGNYSVKRIRGVDDPETLRWNGWAQRFYYAGLDHEIILAEFLLAKEYFERELGRLKSYLKTSPDKLARFMNFYNQSGHLRAFFHELNNAAPAYVPRVTSQALDNLASISSADEFLKKYYETVKQLWPTADQVTRIYDHTAEGAKVKVFENEFSYEDFEAEGDLRQESADTEIVNNEWEEHFFSEEDLTSNWSNAAKINQYYAVKLGWNQYYDQINNLLLPYSGQQNVSLGEEAFAQAVAAWQQAQGFSLGQCDGIIGPHTWEKLKALVTTSYTPTPSPAPSPSLSTGSAPSVQNIFDFNRWHAQRILDTMNAGVMGTNFSSKDQLEKIVRGEKVLNVNPNTTIIQVLPVISHIAEQATLNQYKEIIVGSFIRPASSDGSCTGHCAGRCIDINFRGGNFETAGSVQMVTNILNYLLALPSNIKQNLGFGLPLQGSFFGHRPLQKFHSLPVSYIQDAAIGQLISQLGIVFPDNDNHLHIQVRWK